MKMNNFLVTGCAGFIGSHMVDVLRENNHNVLGIDNLTYAAKMENIEHHLENGIMACDEFKLYPFDISIKTNMEHVFNNNDIDCIINFAAETHVDNSIESCNEFIWSNILGVSSLLDVCRETGRKLFHI